MIVSSNSYGPAAVDGATTDGDEGSGATAPASTRWTTTSGFVTTSIPACCATGAITVATSCGFGSPCGLFKNKTVHTPAVASPAPINKFVVVIVTPQREIETAAAVFTVPVPKIASRTPCSLRSSSPRRRDNRSRNVA